MIVFAWYGSTLSEGWMSWFLALLLPMGAMAAWGIFAVSDDPSRSGKTVVETPGWVRLMLEILIFILGVLFLLQLGYPVAAYVFMGLLILHHILYRDRMLWLIRK